MGITKDHEFGAAFDLELQEQKRIDKELQRQLKKKEEKRAKKEAKRREERLMLEKQLQ